MGVRRDVHMAALLATRVNLAIRTFFKRPIKADKTMTVALTACAHKLLLIHNAIVPANAPLRQPDRSAAA